MSDAKSKETPATPASAANTWTTWVALTTTILAVGAAFSTLKGGSYSTQTQLATVNASNKWSYFQSKSIKETSYKTELSILDVMAANATTPEGKAVAAKAAEKAAKEVVRYEKEKEEIRVEAETLESLAKYCQKRGGNFGLAVMFLQIAIMLSAVAALLKKKPAWLLGLGIGVIGIGYLLYAWPLYETIVGAPPALATVAK
jgi:hypothetical protein